MGGPIRSFNHTAARHWPARHERKELSMQTQRHSAPRHISAVIGTALVAFAALAGCAPATGAPVAVPDRAAQAWTDRLNGLAQERAERMQDVDRRQRADDAYAQRLTELARAQEAEQRTRERANQAWTDRLNGMAEAMHAER